MNKMSIQKFPILFFSLLTFTIQANAQNLRTGDDYFLLNARQDDPVYTTYAAAIERSKLYGDKAYKMVYYDDAEPVYYESDQSGRHFGIWVVNDIAIMQTREFFQPPVVKYSFPDMVVLEYMPFEGVNVQETFVVYSSSVSLVDLKISNAGNRELKFVYYPIVELGNDSLEVQQYEKNIPGYVTTRNESLYRLISSMSGRGNYPTRYREVFSLAGGAGSYGAYRGNMNDFYLTIKTDHYAEDKYKDKLNRVEKDWVDFIALQTRFELKPGESTELRYIRGIQPEDENIGDLKKDIQTAKNLSTQQHLETNETLFAHIPKIDFKTESEKMIYLGALNLARGCMLPPEGETSYNYYVFSRNPLWGWGHGHQVLHESLAMLAYAYLDPVSSAGIAAGLYGTTGRRRLNRLPSRTPRNAGLPALTVKY
jgi:hypothetical protein